jgi:hypothetical protein
MLLSWNYYVEGSLNFFTRMIESQPFDDQLIGQLKSQMKHDLEKQTKIQLYLQMILFPVLCAIAALRRRKSGRA